MRHPSYCCQNCGDFIGWMGRFMFPFFHKCRNKTTKHMTEYTTQTTSIKFDKNFINPAVLIHHDGRVTISDDLKPDEAAKKMFKIFKDLWANDAQSAKIRDLELRILKLKTAGNEMYKFINPPSPCMRTTRMDDLLQGWDDAKINTKEAKP